MGNGTTTVGTPTIHIVGWLMLIKCLYKGVIKLLSTCISQLSSKNGKLYRYPVQNMNTSAVTKLWSFKKIFSFSILSTPNTSIMFDGRLLFNLNVMKIFNFYRSCNLLFDDNRRSEMITNKYLSLLWLKYIRVTWLTKSRAISIPEAAAPKIKTLLPEKSSGFLYEWLCITVPEKFSIPGIFGI